MGVADFFIDEESAFIALSKSEFTFSSLDLRWIEKYSSEYIEVFFRTRDTSFESSFSLVINTTSKRSILNSGKYYVY